MTGKTRILFVIDRFVNPFAGTEGQLFQLIKNLPRERFEPELLVFQTSEFLSSGKIPCPVHVLGRHRIVDPRTWLALLRFARRMKSRGFGLAHIFFNDASVICPPVFRACGILPVISRRDMGYWYTPGYLFALRQTGRFVSHVVVNSNAVRNVTAESERISRSRISVIYNGYEPAPLEETGEISELAALKKNADSPLAVLVANLRPIKRITDAISAVAVLNRKSVVLNLVLVGGGDSSALRSHAEKEGVSDLVHFLGSRPDVRGCLSYMDIGLLCSESEGYSNAIVEYMNQGLPVVASRVGGNREAVEHESTGFLYSMGNVGQFAEHLAVLAQDSEMRREMGEAGRKLAQNRHSLTNMIDAHISLYHRLVDQTEPGREDRVSL